MRRESVSIQNRWSCTKRVLLATRGCSRGKEHERKTNATTTHRSAHGMRANPEHAKQIASPRRPVASPTKATGPRTSSHVNRFWNSISVETQISRSSTVQNSQTTDRGRIPGTIVMAITVLCEVCDCERIKRIFVVDLTQFNCKWFGTCTNCHWSIQIEDFNNANEGYS